MDRDSYPYKSTRLKTRVVYNNAEYSTDVYRRILVTESFSFPERLIAILFTLPG